MALDPETAATLVHEIFDLQRAVRCITVSNSRAGDMGPAPHFVLRLVGQGECRATGLAVRLGIGAPVLSRHIADLEERGYVVRKKDPGDGRAQLVGITALGVERLNKLDAERSAIFQGYLSEWDEEETLRTAETLHRLTQSLVTNSTAARSTVP